MGSDRRSPVELFRKRLQALLDTQYDGRYTVFAREANIPVSTMQHYMHHARHLPGGEHLMRIARACGTTVDYLITGDDLIRPSDLLTNPVSIVMASGSTGAPTDRQLAVPAFACACPETCVLRADRLSPQQAAGQIIIPAALVEPRTYPRLVAVVLQKGMLEAAEQGWAIVDWAARTVTAQEQPFLYFDGARHRLGRLRRDGAVLLAVQPVAVLPPTAAVQGALLAQLVRV